MNLLFHRIAAYSVRGKSSDELTRRHETLLAATKKLELAAFISALSAGCCEHAVVRSLLLYSSDCRCGCRYRPCDFAAAQASVRLAVPGGEDHCPGPNHARFRNFPPARFSSRQLPGKQRPHRERCRCFATPLPVNSGRTKRERGSECDCVGEPQFVPEPARDPRRGRGRCRT